MKEFRVFGPPGTGKTRSLTENLARAVDKFGPDKVMVASFTRAAAHEIVERIDNRDIPKGQIGTLHAIAWRALGRPEIAETHLAEFNEEHPHFKLNGGQQSDVDDPMAAEQLSVAEPGDQALQQMSMLRTRLVPREIWPDALDGFVVAWEGFKAETGYLDFTDLLEQARAFGTAPGAPAVGFIDEAQDLTPLQIALVRQWASRMDHLVLYADDDQTLYSWAGADPASLVADDIPADHKRVLRRSYRLPSEIHALASRWIGRASLRQAKEFLPDHEGGEIIRLPQGHWRAPEAIVDLIERIRGRRVMLLGSCGYMLKPAMAEMRERGLIWHNPYRPNRGDWNPWKAGPGSTTARVAAFIKSDETGLNPRWSWKDMLAWSGLVQARGALKHGAKKRIEETAKDYPNLDVEPAVLRELLAEGPWSDAFHPWSDAQRLLQWLEQNAVAARREQIGWLLRCFERDPSFLLEARKPNVVVGTIHSVKGGEADVVVLLPDLSQQAAISWARGAEHRDAVLRTFYVGMTRTRSVLVLAGSAGHSAVDIR